MHQQIESHYDTLTTAAADTNNRAAYEEYQAQFVKEGTAHPVSIIETASLASITLPKITYKHHLQDVVKAQSISSPQLESVIYACMRFEKKIDSRTRAGFFLGDGAGVGKGKIQMKRPRPCRTLVIFFLLFHFICSLTFTIILIGRQIAANILEHYRTGGMKVLWVSVSTDLREDAARDLRDLNVTQAIALAEEKLYPESATTLIPMGDLDKMIGDSILFCTYSFLVSGSAKKYEKFSGESKRKRKEDTITTPGLNPDSNMQIKTGTKSLENVFGDRKKSRSWQILSWLGKDKGKSALLIFDECHKAKNLKSLDGMPSRSAQVVLELQKELPDAKVIYASATGASEPADLAYMERLGSFKFDSMNAMVKIINKASHSGCEIASMGLKANGAYLCRSLSFKGAEFEVHKCKFSDDFKNMFDRSTEYWQLLLTTCEKILAFSGVRKSLAQFWSAHQQFYKLMLIAGKLPDAVRLSKMAVQNDMCVVIGMQTTGESALQYSKASSQRGGDEFVSAPKMIIQRLVENLIPSADKILDQDTVSLSTWDKLIERLEISISAWTAGGFAPNDIPSDDHDTTGVEIVQEKTLDEIEIEKIELAKRTGKINSYQCF